jgi:tryptophan-rich sensory protein
MNWPALLLFFALVGGVAFLGGKWGANEWYRSLRKPSFTPPDWAFPVAWSILYTLIAISGYRIWQAESAFREPALLAWAVQLVANAAWSYLFFGRRNIGAGLADIVILWASIAAYILFAWPADRIAALLFVPYLAWVSLAAALNRRILQLNRAA